MANDQYGGPGGRPTKEPYGIGDPNNNESKPTPFNPGTYARDAYGHIVYDANHNPVIIPYGGGGGGVAPVGAGGGSGSYGATGATTGTTATYGGGTAAGSGGGAAAGSAAGGLAGSPFNPASYPASYAGAQPSVWQNIISALGSGSAGSYASAIKEYGPYIMALISALGGNKGKFEQQPESPQLTAARDKQLGFVDNSPTRNLYGGLLQSFVGGGAGGGWKAPAPMAGGQFYQSQGLGEGGNSAISAYIAQVMAGLQQQGGGGSGLSGGLAGFTPEKDKINIVP